jgi:hypothetical protein
MFVPWFYQRVGFQALVSRGAKFGEFSPIGKLFTLGGFVKITEVAQIFWQLFST